jgi:hypothetical protein
MWWFRRLEEPPPGLPPNYAVFRAKDGWYFVQMWPRDMLLGGGRPPERHRDGPFPERDDARYWAWQHARETGAVPRG